VQLSLQNPVLLQQEFDHVPLLPFDPSEKRRDKRVAMESPRQSTSPPYRSSFETLRLQRVLQPAAKDVGLGRLTWHQFRHIHSSLLNDLRVPAKIAQEQLGDASVSTTLGIYTHVVDASHRSAVEAVEERLFVETVSNCLESAGSLETAIPASDSVN
jgi:integrase